jgi:antitoxin VapB
MALNIKDPNVHELARRLAERRGITLTAAVRQALDEALANSGPRPRLDARRERLDAIARHCAALPVRDSRPADEILGYDEDGLPM